MDIPVPQDFGGLGGDGGFQGFSPGQGTPAADVEQIVDIPVPQDRREGGGGLQISLPGQGSTATSSSSSLECICWMLSFLRWYLGGLRRFLIWGMGISYVELLILYERWACERLC